MSAYNRIVCIYDDRINAAKLFYADGYALVLRVAWL